MALTKIPSNLITLDAIDGTLIADDAINSEHIADGAIDAAHMSANSIDSDSYVDGSIDTAHIGDDQVTADKLANSINTSIAAKAPLASPTFTGTITFGDGHSIGNDGDDNLAITGSANENIIIDSADDIILDADGGDVIFRDGGVEKMRLDAGDLGIGTTSPAAELHIHDEGGLAAIRLSGTASSADNFQIMQGVTGVTNAGFSIYDVDATTNRLVIDTNGKVLVGQTSAVTNGKLQVTGGIGLTGNSEIRSSTNSDNGDTIKFFGTQFVAGSNSHSYGYSGAGQIASLSTSGNKLLLDVGNTGSSGHRFKVKNAGNGIDGSLQYIDGTTVRFHVDSSTGIIKENDIPVRSRAIAMAMVFG